MTLDEIKARIAEIESSADNPEHAHELEDKLRGLFVRHVAQTTDDRLRDMAKLVLTTSQIEFARWCA